MSLEDIIRLLGGNTAVAKWCGVELAAVSNWKVRGIPKGRQLDLYRMAQAKRCRLTLEELAVADAMIERKPEPPRQRRRSSAECVA